VDHVAGLAGLISFRWLSRNPGGPSEIYGPPGTRQVVDGAVRFMTLPTEIHREQLPPIAALADSVAAFDKEAKGPTIIYKDDRVTVTAVENSHYSGFAPGAIPAGTRSYAYRFDTADRSIVFTGDTGPSEALEKLTAGADTLVSEVVSIPEALHFLEDRFHVPPEQLNAQRGHMADEHFQPERIGELAARAGVRLVVLNHVVMGNTDDGRAYTDGVRKTFKGVVALGQDLSEF
jgi:ribonuclease BN (tRNA processing enzyme)